MREDTLSLLLHFVNHKLMSVHQYLFFLFRKETPLCQEALPQSAVVFSPLSFTVVIYSSSYFSLAYIIDFLAVIFLLFSPVCTPIHKILITIL